MSETKGLALKKRAAKFLLQPDNGIGQRGLGNAAAFGRAGEATLLAERQKSSGSVAFACSTSRYQSCLASEAAIGTGF